MHARARLAVAADRAPGVTRVTELRSDPPFVLRPTRTRPAVMPGWWTDARPLVVSIAASAAGPLGGDRLRLDVDVGPGAAVVVRGVSASVVLPGHRGERSSMSVHIRAAEGATVVWHPGATIATRRCQHDSETIVEIDDDARLLVREELVLGRHGETAGTLCQSLRVTRSGRPLLHQDLRLGDDDHAWEGPAVTGGRRALGAIVMTDPAWTTDRPDSPPAELPAGTAILDLEGPAALACGAASHAHVLRRHLDVAMDRLEQRSAPAVIPETAAS